ncbi:MAG: hypothetical protein AAGA48_34895 [Myxococcota bacterium]
MFRQPLGPFAGRDQELRVLGDALIDEGSLVVVTGMGGIGKSRLAAECALRWEGSVLTLTLDGATEINDAVRSFSSILQPDAPFEDLAKVVQELRVRGPDLLILDGFEAMAHHGPEILGQLRTSGVKMLVTSRIPIALVRQRRLGLTPLSRDDARQVLLGHARRHDLSFDANSDPMGMNRLLEHLDGVPLAIELAACRLRTFTPSQLAKRLDAGMRCLRSDAMVDRHASIVGILDWSIRQLPPSVRNASLVLAAVEGPLSPEVAEALLDEVKQERDGTEGLEALDCLLERGLLYRSDERRDQLAMLGIVRRALLAGASVAERTQAFQHHAAFFLKRNAGIAQPDALLVHLLRGGGAESHLADLPQLERIVERSGLPMATRVTASYAVFSLLVHHHPTWRYDSLAQLLAEAVEDEEPTTRARAWLVYAHAAVMNLFPSPPIHELASGYEVLLSQGDEESAAQLGYFVGRSGGAPKGFDIAAARTRAARAKGPVSQLWMHFDRNRHLYLLSRPHALDLVVRSQLDAKAYPVLCDRWTFHRAALLLERGRFVEVRRLLLRADRRRMQPTDRIILECLLARTAFATDSVDLARERLAIAEAIATDNGIGDPFAGVFARTRWLVALSEGRAVDVLAESQQLPPGPLVASSQQRWMEGLAYLMQRDPDTAEAVVSVAWRKGQWPSDRALEDGIRALVHAWRGEALEAQRAIRVAQGRSMCRRSYRVQAALQAMAEVANRWLCTPIHGLTDSNCAPYLAARAVLPLKHVRPDASPSVLRVDPELRWCEAPSGVRLDLAQRPVLRRLLAELVTARLEQPGRVVPAEQLITAGWPGDRSSTKSLRNRLWVALSRLRRQGWEGAIERVNSGYRIRADLPLQQVP